MSGLSRLAQRAVLVAAALVGLLAAVPAQQPPAQLDGAAILHRLHKLETVGSALYLAAHPDDENTRLITWLGNGRKVRTGYLALTRGDGGQDLIGPELGDALGILRTQELLQARRIDGGEQFFTRAVDFGYSKSPEESFAKWGRQEILGDVVRVIRTFRPDVIITRFAPDGSGGHGHHTASAQLAQEAFDLAADRSAFPEQLAEGLQPWQPKRLFFNASTWWRADVADEAGKDPAHWLAVDVGGFDPLLGASYTELAGRSRSQHKSQGFGAAETRGEQLEYLRLDKGAPLSGADLFDGIDLSWSRVEGGAGVQALLADVIRAYDPQAPERSLTGLAGVVRALDALAASPAEERDRARFQANAARELILQICGVVVQVTSAVPTAAAGDSLSVTVSALQRAAGPALELVSVTGPDGATTAVGQPLPRNRAVESTLAWAIPATQPADQPYWLAAPHGALYQPDRTRHAGVASAGGASAGVASAGVASAGVASAGVASGVVASAGSAPVGIEPMAPGAAMFRVELRLPDGTSLRVDRQAMNSWVDRVAGERTRPVAITPVASLEVADAVALVAGERASVAVDVKALTKDVSGELSATLPHGWTIERAPPPVAALALGERTTLHLDLRRGPDAVRGVMHLSFAGPKGSSDRTLHVIDYPHILPQTWSTPADVVLLPEAVAVSTQRVGYIEGAGDEIPAALERLGVAVERIDPAVARASDLERCETIVTGIRAYNTVPALALFQPTLLHWVEGGGTLLVQYDTNGSDLVLPASRIGPHPFELTRDRVTLEDAAPTFLAPTHPLMLFPNALQASDFDGWVQERGIYFAGSLDPAYVPLIAWNDPGEAPLNGALIACDHGKGRFIYTGLSLFRQLPAGVPGSYRILANLIARRSAGT